MDKTPFSQMLDTMEAYVKEYVATARLLRHAEHGDPDLDLHDARDRMKEAQQSLHHLFQAVESAVK